MIAGYDEWKTTPPEPGKVEIYCDSCGSEIYEGEYYYRIDFENYCEACMKEAFGRYA